MPTIRRILVPTDFTELSGHAAEHARSLAELCGAEIHVVHVMVPVATESPTAAPGAMPLTPVSPSMPDMVEGVRSNLADFALRHFSGMSTTVETLAGIAHLEICRYARDHACDLIVIGSHARGIVHRLFLGSVSKAVLEHAPCPLLIVPLKAIESAADLNANEQR